MSKKKKKGYLMAHWLNKATLSQNRGRNNYGVTGSTPSMNYQYVNDNDQTQGPVYSNRVNYGINHDKYRGDRAFVENTSQVNIKLPFVNNSSIAYTKGREVTQSRGRNNYAPYSNTKLTLFNRQVSIDKQRKLNRNNYVLNVRKNGFSGNLNKSNGNINKAFSYRTDANNFAVNSRINQNNYGTRGTVGIQNKQDNYGIKVGLEQGKGVVSGDIHYGNFNARINPNHNAIGYHTKVLGGNLDVDLQHVKGNPRREIHEENRVDFKWQRPLW